MIDALANPLIKSNDRETALYLAKEKYQEYKASGTIAKAADCQEIGKMLIAAIAKKQALIKLQKAAAYIWANQRP